MPNDKAGMASPIPITYGEAFTVMVYAIQRLQYERERRGMSANLDTAPDLEAKAEAAAVLLELARAQDARDNSNLEQFSDAAIHLAYCNNYYWSGEYKLRPSEDKLPNAPLVYRREEIGGALLRHLADRIMIYQHKLH